MRGRNNHTNDIREENDTMTITNPTTAEELATVLRTKRDAAEQATNQAAEEAVDAFLAQWSEKMIATQKFTKEEMINLFGEKFWYATGILQKKGFKVIKHGEEVTGHLWWRKVTPEKWEITIPDEILYPKKPT